MMLPHSFRIFLACTGLAAAQEFSFEKDCQLLGDGVVLGQGTRQVLVSPHFQGAVLVSNLNGKSIGWINRDAIKARKGGVGGADRFWFGPDGSQFTVFFEPGAPLEEENWRVAPEVAEGAMKVLRKSETEVVMEREICLQNNLGTSFKTCLTRTVTLTLPKKEEGVSSVGFTVENEITNLGEPWQAEKGLLSLWSLGSFQGGDSVEVHMPISEQAQVRQYFEPFQKEQLTRKDGQLSFKVDGNWRSKIGLAPEDSPGLMLSLDRDRKLLTVVRYQVSQGERFPHAERGPQERPYRGDLANVYNHGNIDRTPLVLPQFYEMESASPMFELKKGESVSHWQSVSHYRAELSVLEAMAARILKKR